VEKEVGAGTLVPALELPLDSDEGHLVWLADRSVSPPLVAFRQWMLAFATFQDVPFETAERAGGRPGAAALA
jgi:DNA-binding transcriptional LysR family regulator